MVDVIYDIVEQMCDHDGVNYYLISNMWYPANCFLSVDEYRDKQLNKVLGGDVL